MASTKTAVTSRSKGADKISLSRVEETTLAECEAVIKENMVGFIAVGEAWKQINEGRLYRAAHKSFQEYCNKRWEFDRQRAYQLIRSASVAQNVKERLHVIPERESHVRPLISLKPEMQIAVWETVTARAKADNVRITADLVQSVRGSMKEDGESIGQFNSTNENIDWARWSWNPVTGCEHGCAYCYARETANLRRRLFPKEFKPHLRSERLAIPAKMEKLRLSDSDKDIPGIRAVFTCGMADLFGDWVPKKWIDTVMAAVRQAPSWNFLFLTKNPKRLVDMDWPDNAWAGATVDTQARVRPTIAAMKKVKAKVRFVSCEPLLAELKFPTMKCFDWVIIGAQSSHGSLPEFQPEVAWVNLLIDQAQDAGCRVYCKPNLRWSLREYPGA
jgi:protein gp37